MKVQIEAYVCYREPYAWMPDDHGFVITSYDPSGFSDTGIVLVDKRSIEVEVPDNFDPRPEMVKSLEREKELAKAEFAKKVMEIDRRINELLALEFTA